MDNISEARDLTLYEGKTEQKTRFIEMRAKGYPYSKICKELGVSKTTLSVWNTELSDEVKRHKSESLQELYDAYYMHKEARIKRLGDTLSNIDKELSNKDLSQIPADKLLDYKLKYMDALREEYVEPQDTETVIKVNAQGILDEIVSLLNKVKRGEITKEQALRENLVIANLLKAYESNVLEKKIEALQAIINSRG